MIVNEWVLLVILIFVAFGGWLGYWLHLRPDTSHAYKKISAVRAVIFDCFGVLLAETSKSWFEKNLGTSDRVTQIHDDLCRPLDLGELGEVDFFSKLAEYSNTSASSVRSDWVSGAVPDEATLALVRQLGGEYKLAILSNASEKFFHDTVVTTGVAGLFDEVVVSSREGFIKPDKEIFKRALSRLEVDASETVFFDDNPKNVAAARALGLHAFLFTDAIRARESLKQVGVRV